MAKRKGGRGVSGPAADAGSGWWLLGGLAVVGGVVAAIIWSQSKPAAKPAATARRNGAPPLPPPVEQAPSVDMTRVIAEQEAADRQRERSQQGYDAEMARLEALADAGQLDDGRDPYAAMADLNRWAMQRGVQNIRWRSRPVQPEAAPATAQGWRRW